MLFPVPFGPPTVKALEPVARVAEIVKLPDPFTSHVPITAHEPFFIDII